jgi:hypothetical protein
MRLTLNTMPAVAQAEYLHQQRSIDNRRHRWWVILPGQVMLVLSIFCVSFIFMILAGETLGLFKMSAIPASFRPIVFILWVVLPGFTVLPTAFVMHFGLMMRTLLWTANSVPREKVTGTWDLLLLTGTSGSSIVYNKWWATVRRAFPAYLRLAALRAGVVMWFLQWTRMYVNFHPELIVEFNNTSPLHPLALTALIAVIFGFTLLNLLVTAAVGMLAALITKRSAWNTGLAAIIRSLVFLLPLGVLFLLTLFFPPYYSSNTTESGVYILYNLSLLSAVSLGDNGMTLSYLATSLIYFYMTFPRDYIIYFGAYILPVLAYLLVMLLSLRWAAALAVRQGALKPEKRKKRSVVSNAKDS